MKGVGARASCLVAVSLTVALVGWMFAGVAEYPGLPRDVGRLPPWFAGGQADVAPGNGPPAASATAPSPGPAGSVTPPAPATPAAPGGPPPPAGMPGADAGYAEVAGSEVTIVLKEYQLVPDRVRVRPGRPTITFVLRNEGRFAHNFHIEGPGVDATASRFGPGRTARLEVTLQEGEYRISCPLSNHDQRGMHGTLLVTPEPGGG